ncbi:2',3'-cyclic-nucleotide 2'-phosphodiesterase/3'-nucleotidase [Pullulanibacillus pueri]|uniref:2',3'-cyclic-nucleotide 2'-phosphodiesterase n=1 Tax=Pullulanibacillus pueri TaxID=1437324 RepID=A0A8J2ZXQ2_9BACL|nr:bifunctional UDP-sugar hydrolase/5'-nucleotidase [Pullulanibacillus pueri]MBM7683207.1 2',3'-cyclic-nucleotide 2'-phosphodiesterase/3'-nucleotidase [Pullulanibacillus pueri]GGH85576.1 2',3'-cyclic-nucleotide 2'-phosphodiesterase [Pullulanibacillus pueri]
MSKIECVILETSDIHGNVLPLNYGTNKPSELGFAKVATLIREERKRHENVMVIDNGDVIQGTPLTYHFARFDKENVNPMMKLLNALHYDAAVFGNHEFNYGLGHLTEAVEASHFPWLSANLLNKETGDPYFGQPYILKTVGESGPTIAILGLTTKYIPNWEKEEHIEGMAFVDVVETAKKWVPFLREEKGADIVVISYHGGFERDLESGEPTETLTGENQGYELCQSVEGIDVLLTGHQHRMIEDKDINGVLLIQPGSTGLALGKVTLTLEETEEGWRCLNKQSELLSVEGVQPDEEVVELIQPYEKATQAWLDQPIGHIKGNMLVEDPLAIRLQDNPLIEFINKVQMETADVDISNTALFDNNSPGFPENVTMRSVVGNYIYPNTLVVLRVQGRDIKAALEQSAGYFELKADGTIGVSPAFTTPKPQHYNYDMWEGIDYAIDVRKPIGERITHIDYHGAPLEMDQSYDVVLNNYRAAGGGDYHMYQGKEVVKDIPIDVSELIANYIIERKVIEPTVDGNWKVIY